MRRLLLATAAVLATTVFSAFALSRLVHADVWLSRTLICLGVVAVVVVLGRVTFRSDWLPSLLGLVAAPFALCAAFVSGSSLLGVLPTRASLDEIGRLVASALVAMRESTPPITEHAGVGLVLTTGIVLVYLFAELLAIGAAAPGWFGLPVLGLWAIPIVIGAHVDAWVFVAAALGFLGVLAIQSRPVGQMFGEHHPPERRADPRALVATGTVMALSLGVALLASPGVLRLPSPGRLHTVYDLVGASSTRLDLGLDLRDDLTRRQDATLVTYDALDPTEMGPLQAYTLTDFNGSSWERGDEATDGEPVAGRVLWPQQVDGGRLGPSREATITISNLAQDRLLVPTEPRSVQIIGNWVYDAASDEVIGLGSPPAPFTYQVSFRPRDLSAAALDALDPRSLEVPEDLLALPETGYGPDIANLTRQVVQDAGAGTPYQEVLAIQNYLRDDERFTYTTTIAGSSTTDAVWDFLGDRHGYCVQFATAMVMMVRSLGIPARIAIGFLPGEQRPDGISVITGQRAHSWPQVLFPDVGWVRFEPTPSLQSGAAPAWAPVPVTAPGSTASAVPSEVPTGEPTAEPTTAAPGSTAVPGSSAGVAERNRTTVLVVGGLLALVLVGLGALGAWRRRRAARFSLEAHWERVRRRLRREGFDVSAALTPRGLARSAEGRLDPGSTNALSHLAHAVEVARYSRAAARRDDPLKNPEQVETWTAAIIEGARRSSTGVREAL